MSGEPDGTELSAGVCQCEQCGDDVAESDAYTETHAGHRETVTLAFCPDCTDN